MVEDRVAATPDEFVLGRSSSKTSSSAKATADECTLGRPSVRSGTSKDSPLGIPVFTNGLRTRSSTAVATYSSVLSEISPDYPMLCFCEEHNRCRLAPTTGHKGRLPISKKLLFLIPFVGYYACNYLKRTAMKPFYTDDYPRASLGYMAFFTTAGVLVDAFSDPAMANLTDNSRPILGRRRPYILIGGIMALVVFTLGFTPFVPSGIAASLWFGVFHIGAKLVDTVLMIPLDAWGCEMTPNVNERSTLFMFREIGLIVGVLFGAVSPGFFSELGGVNCTETPSNGCIGYPLLAFAFGLFCVFGCCVLAYAGRERPNARLTPPSKKGRFQEDAVVPTLITTWLNRPFRCLIVSDVAEAAGGNLPFVMMPYFTRVVLGDGCLNPSLYFSILAGVNLLSRLGFLPLWVYAAKCFGKYYTYVAYNFLLSFAQLMFIFIGRDTDGCGQMGLVLTVVASWGMCYGGSLFLKSLMSDVADYDEFLTGKRREGQYMMTLEFLPKFIEVPSEAIPFLLLAYLGYRRPTGDGTIPLQPEAVIWLVRLSISIVPAFFILTGAIVLLYFPKEARSTESHRALIVAVRELHRRGLPAQDPWFPGHIVDPPSSTPRPNEDVLNYFWPAELKIALQSGGGSCEKVDYYTLQLRTLRGVAIASIPLCLGAFLMVLGWEDMGSDLGASVSPIGLIFVGIALLILWFDGTRFYAAKEAEARQIPYDDFLMSYNFLCRFTGGEVLTLKELSKQNSNSPQCSEVVVTD